MICLKWGSLRMRYRRVFLSAGGIVLAGMLFFLAACGGGSDSIEYIPVSRSDTCSGSGDEVHYVDTSGYVDLTYTLNGLNAKDVYFVLSNTNPYKTMNNPVLGSEFGPAKAVTAPSRSMSAALASAPQARVTTPRHVQEFNANPPLSKRGATGRAMRSVIEVPPPQRDVVIVNSTTETFYDDTGALIPGTVTARYYNTIDSEVTLTIWIADAWWDGTGADATKINPTKLNELVDKFLLTSTGNDIYDWMTNIFGVPWGPHGYSGILIPAETPLCIDIVMYNIDNDSPPVPVSGESRTVGFFYARDNFLRSSGVNGTATSNERVMFYIDAPLFAHENAGSWDIRLGWPAAVISTLAHEFQHMIHFYQKSVLRNSNSEETWINEMASMAAEDLVADKAFVNGPRGVAYNDASAGSSGNTSGRLPLYNYFNDVAVTQWLSEAEMLKCYSINYALGAYLSRNFGGAKFFQDVVQCDRIDYTAIEYALSQSGAGSGLRFADVLQRWGAAVLLSDNISEPAGLQYNTGNWFQSTLDTETYDLGSINLFNYIYNYQTGTQTGPYLYSGAGPIGYASGHLPASNLYYEAAAGATGSRTWSIRMDSGVRLTVVVKQP